MKFTITDQVFREMNADKEKYAKGLAVLAHFDVNPNAFTYGRRSVELNTYRGTEQQLSTLANALAKMPSGVQGASSAARALRSAVLALGAVDDPIKSIQGSAEAFILYFGTRSKVVFASSDDDVWEPFFIYGIEYHPPRHYHYGGRSPAMLTMKFSYRYAGSLKEKSETFYAPDVKNKSVPQVLESRGYVPENPELLKGHLKDIAVWEELIDEKAVGTQMWASGPSSGLIDDDDDSKAMRWWSWLRTTKIVMLDDSDGPSKVIVDVMKEGDETEERSEYDRRYRHEKKDGADTCVQWWVDKAKAHQAPASKEDTLKSMYDRAVEEDDETKKVDDDDDDDDEDSTPGRNVMAAASAHAGTSAVPIHPVIPVFHLKDHQRHLVHVSRLTEYIYDTKAGSKLILPADTRDLLDVLLAKRGALQDVVKGKSGGVCVLSAGPPGTGKTLTAEVLSETMKRPLFAVQTAQLGSDPDKMEENLAKVFQRAVRWNAILLLDEADVYVRRRGDDMQQNAIVGVFLRTMEYFRGIMMMTTNRIDLVDDAIASRCIAKINYKLPLPEDQIKIWRLLADAMEVPITDKAIETIVEKYNKLSGRDIKQMLKLCKLYLSAKSENKADIKLVEKLLPFKSAADLTGDQAQYAERAGGSLELATEKVKRKLTLE